MKILFIHPSFPAQYKHLVKHFASNGSNQLIFISKEHNVPVPKGVRNIIYKPARGVNPSIHRYLIGAENAVLDGQEVWRVCRKLKEKEGFIPDIICAHPGWGGGLFLKDIYPDVPLLSYFEFYYRFSGADVNFDPETPNTIDDSARVRMKNTVHLHNLEVMDWGITPTHWQKSVHPKAYHDKISVIHEGIDTQTVKPNPEATYTLQDGTVLKKGDPIVTYVTRNFEHYRGSHQFIRAIKHIQELHPEAKVLAVGADDVSYGRRPPNGKHFRVMELEEVKPDLSRVYFTGRIPYEDFIKVLQISSVHIYLTVPFVLSWSMLESMAAGCVVVGSATAPVQEIIADGENGLLVDFFSPKGIARKAVEVLKNQEKYEFMREAARQTIIDRYETRDLIPKQLALIEQVANKQFPPPIHKELTLASGHEQFLYRKAG